MRTYKELSKLKTFEERYRYLRVNGHVGADTFGYDRYLNQVLYSTPEWRKTRREIILRDGGCDMGLPDYPISGKVMIHHLNPITEKDILERRACLFDPENLICVSFDTHNAIHYGSLDMILDPYVERKANDTVPWK